MVESFIVFGLFMATGNPFMQSANTTMTVPATCETATYIVTSADPALSSKSKLIRGAAVEFLIGWHRYLICGTKTQRRHFERVNVEKESVRSRFQIQIAHSLGLRVSPTDERSCETVTAGDSGRNGRTPARNLCCGIFYEEPASAGFR